MIETENYFFEVKVDSDSRKILVLIIYDIIENKKRTKFAKHLEGYGTRVQKSAFEARLTQKKYNKLMEEIPRFCSSEDSIRVYRITGQSQISAWGTKEIPEDDEDVIVI
ncbi:MAG: CRISPR-associated endonuclease Cas2 [Lachnospiraceae bacterium]|nr:CRISPR-associated endonuclease Cas2 [Lachnospiraceae bacterium]